MAKTFPAAAAAAGHFRRGPRVDFPCWPSPKSQREGGVLRARERESGARQEQSTASGERHRTTTKVRQRGEKAVREGERERGIKGEEPESGCPVPSHPNSNPPAPPVVLQDGGEARSTSRLGRGPSASRGFGCRGGGGAEGSLSLPPRRRSGFVGGCCREDGSSGCGPWEFRGSVV